MYRISCQRDGERPFSLRTIKHVEKFKGEKNGAKKHLPPSYREENCGVIVPYCSLCRDNYGVNTEKISVSWEKYGVKLRLLGVKTPSPGREPPPPGSKPPSPGRKSPSPERKSPSPGSNTPYLGRESPSSGSESRCQTEQISVSGKEMRTIEHRLRVRRKTLRRQTLAQVDAKLSKAAVKKCSART